MLHNIDRERNNLLHVLVIGNEVGRNVIVARNYGLTAIRLLVCENYIKSNELNGIFFSGGKA